MHVTASFKPNRRVRGALAHLRTLRLMCATPRNPTGPVPSPGSVSSLHGRATPATVSRPREGWVSASLIAIPPDVDALGAPVGMSQRQRLRELAVRVEHLLVNLDDRHADHPRLWGSGCIALHMPNRRNVGLSLDERIVDRLDDRADSLDEQVARRVTRSEVAREVIPIGLDAVDVLDQRRDAGRLSLNEQRAMVRQALHSHEPEMWASTDHLVERLAEAEGVDPDALRDAIRRIKLDG